MVKSRATLGKVKLENFVDGAAPIIYADELRMKQILVNLISNAVKFTPPGGKVSITTKIAKNKSVLLLVSDTGIGMNAAELATAMEKFGQADSKNPLLSSEGTGLGLPLTKGLVEAHSGTLGIESKPNKGTTVTVSLPMERIRKAPT